MPTVLSTKILSPKLKRHLFAADIGLVEYDAVKIKPLSITFPQTHFENAIFTSQNAVKIALDKELKFENVFCVGDKTAALLSSKGYNPKIVADNAKALAEAIIEKYPSQSFSFFCSAQRRDELPKILIQNKIKLQEYHLYKSIPKRRTFKNSFDAVLCFSPLGVKAYYEYHDSIPVAICIGETTAEEANKFTDKVLVANKTSLESVVIKAINAIKFGENI